MSEDIIMLHRDIEMCASGAPEAAAAVGEQAPTTTPMTTNRFPVTVVSNRSVSCKSAVVRFVRSPGA